MKAGEGHAVEREAGGPIGEQLAILKELLGIVGVLAVAVYLAFVARGL